MAVVPITKTWLQLKLLSGGSPCHEIISLKQANHPSLQDGDPLDVFTWTEECRTAGLSKQVIPSLIRGMTGVQRRTLLIWLLNKLLANLPPGWSENANMQIYIPMLVNYLNGSNVTTGATLQTYASSFDVNHSDQNEHFFKDAVQRCINFTLVGPPLDYEDIAIAAGMIGRGLHNILGQTENTNHDSALTLIQTILNIR